MSSSFFLRLPPPKSPSSALAEMALTDRSFLLDRNLTIVKEGLVAARRFFTETHPESFVWIPPRAGPVAFPQLRVGAGCGAGEGRRVGGAAEGEGAMGGGDEGVAGGGMGGGAERYCRYLDEKARLMVLPSTVFKHGDASLRVSFGRRNTAALFDVWGEAHPGYAKWSEE